MFKKLSSLHNERSFREQDFVCTLCCFSLKQYANVCNATFITSENGKLAYLGAAPEQLADSTAATGAGVRALSRSHFIRCRKNLLKIDYQRMDDSQVVAHRSTRRDDLRRVGYA
jgi:hypothetical protein